MIFPMFLSLNQTIEISLEIIKFFLLRHFGDDKEVGNETTLDAISLK